MNLKQRAIAENEVVKELGKIKGWVGATALAARLGWPWRIVSRTMARLAEQGRIESKASEWKSKRSRIRKTTIYRVTTTAAVGVFPNWLEPKIPEVVGARLVVQLVDDESQEGRG